MAADSLIKKIPKELIRALSILLILFGILSVYTLAYLGQIDPLKILRPFADGYAVIGVSIGPAPESTCINLIIEKKGSQYYWTTNEGILLKRLDYYLFQNHRSIYINPRGEDVIKVQHRPREYGTDVIFGGNISEIQANKKGTKDYVLLYKSYSTYPIWNYPQNLKFKQGHLVIGDELPDIPFCEGIKTKVKSVLGDWNIYRRLHFPKDGFEKVKCNVSDDFSKNFIKEKREEYVRGKADPSPISYDECPLK